MRLAQIQLNSFKSFRDAILPLGPLTILTGRNSSGKSNAIDAIAVLSCLVTSGSLSDALEGTVGRLAPVRGGAKGCAPSGEDSFSLGCVIEDEAKGFYLIYEVEVAVNPVLRIKSESLHEAPGSGSKGNDKVWFKVCGGEGGSLDVEYRNGAQEKKPHIKVRDDRTVLGQLKSRLITSNETLQELILHTEAVIGVLSASFYVDPVPQQMRHYVPKRAEPLRRNGDNLSAVLFGYRQEDPQGFKELENLVKEIAGCPVDSLGFSMTDNDEVMIALEGGKRGRTTASLMSDGLLRFMTVATALKTAAGAAGQRPGLDEGTVYCRLVTIEEIENGLHPSHADRLLGLIRQAAKQPDVSVLITTHSPALLDALRGEGLRSVYVCHDSTITPLVEMPDYAAAMAQGTLGRVVTQGRLLSDEGEQDRDFSKFYALLGVGA
ncbi:AAA family ATPase [Actinomyces bovis]|nr:ATP-binding protein [Actinomyces bovis]